MTGYSGNVKAFVADANSQLIPFEDFGFALYNIHNGWEINRGGEYIVAGPNLYGDPVLNGGDWDSATYCEYFYFRKQDDYCQVQTNITAYTTQYGFSSSANTSSTFMNITIPGPVLNISYFYIPSRLRTDNDDGNMADKSRMTWVHSNVTYPIDYIKTHGSCQPLLDYRWGFSYIQLFFMVIFLFIWSIGIYTLWLRSHIIMKKRDRQDVAGETKAVFELADAMRLQLEEHGVEEGFKISTLPESRLRRRIAKDLRGGTISYKTSLLQSGKDGEGDSGWGFKAWVKREKYWLAAFFVAIAVMLGGVLSSTVYTATVTYGLPLEIIFTMYLGKMDNSRVVIFLWSFIILSVFPQIVVSIVLASPSYRY
ncbi:hypothetical protein N0V83_002084 [Neocucurbitaria cava]|uniref:Uncharacterized protein n=1 Tax=Neocucurbitaria cava TaxID=798079 RepID=A0A9W9CPQ9_9PLEO|nr:hypothetical protein N0V83_002084 [Neocucurbitaria cava]